MGIKINADLNAARNIAKKSRLQSTDTEKNTKLHHHQRRKTNNPQDENPTSLRRGGGHTVINPLGLR